MITLTLLLLILAFVVTALALFVQYDRVNLTAVGLILVIIALLLGNVQ
jgi:hypothetical protein